MNEMMQNHRLARSIADSSWTKLISMLEQSQLVWQDHTESP